MYYKFALGKNNPIQKLYFISKTQFMGRGVWWLLVGFVLLVGIAVWALMDKNTIPLSAPTPPPTPTIQRQRLIAIGDSLTAGYQLLPEESFPAQLQQRFEQAGIDRDVINGGKSGDTSAQIRERFHRSLADSKTGDIILLTVGGNDGLQGLPVDQLEENMRRMIGTAKEKGLIVVLGGMKLPRNYGTDYIETFEAIYPRLAQETETLLIPFILEGVAADPRYNLEDGIHPNAEGYKIIAQTVFDFLQVNKLLE